jgi:hypothetical protein
LAVDIPHKKGMEMFRSGIVLKLAFFAALALPASLPAQMPVTYQPHYLSSLQEAANQLQTLSPHYAPMEDQGNKWALTNSYTLARVDVSKQGIKLYFSKSPAQQIQFLWNWNGISTAAPYAPYTGDIITTMLFANISRFQILNFYQAANVFTAIWCVNPDGQPAASNSVLCIDTQENAQALLDALATLVVAGGGDLAPDSGIGDVSAIAAKPLKKYPNESGGTIASVTPGGTAAQAGIQAGDILHAVNGKPYVINQGMVGDAVRDVAWHKPGGVVHVDIFRNHVPMSIDIHYSKQPVDVAKLQQQSAEFAQQPGAAPAGLHFGFQLRPVIADDLTPLMLPKAQGLVVVSVENGSLADTMGVLAGDVILLVNGADAGGLPHFKQLAHDGAITTFSVWRKGKTLELTVPQSI